MITLSNGHSFDFCCASGALAFDGGGWFWEWPLRWVGLIRPDEMTVVAKTVTLQPRKGNLRWWRPWTCVRVLRHGVVNAVGLTNPGIQWWIDGPYRRAKRRGYPVAASVYPMDADQAERMGAMLADLELAYIELNPSCPNVDHENDPQHILGLLDGLARSCGHPKVVKLSHGQAMDADLPAALRESGHAEAIHAINTVPWERIFPGKRSPLEKHTGSAGGVSGPYIKTHALEAIEHVKKIAALPVIGGGGISNYGDLAVFQKAGADAFSIGTLFLRKPWAPRRLIRDFRAAR